MSTETPLRTGTPPSGALLDAHTRGIVELVAEGLTELAGFGVAALSVVRGDEWETVAVAGDDEARAALLGVRRPVATIRSRLSIADEWGEWRFVPAERLDPGDRIAWEPDLPQPNGDRSWRARDLLFAPIHDGEGTLRGMLAVDLPADGRRPGPERRTELDRYAAQASRSLLMALDQADLAERARMLHAAQEVCRTAFHTLDMANADDCRAEIIRGFDAFGMWIHTLDKSVDWPGTNTIAPAVEPILSPPTTAVVERVARSAWDRQEVVRLAIDRQIPPYLLAAGDVDALRPLVAQFEQHRVATALLVPIGAGPECLGGLLLTRPHGAREWTEVEQEVALEIGHDLGSALVNARSYAREQQVVAELLSLDSYRSQLVATLAHELKNPLAAVINNLELLAGQPGLGADGRDLLAEVGESGRDLAMLVERLLVLVRVQDESRELRPEPVDLAEAAADAVDELAPRARRAQVTITLDAPPERVVVPGERADLRRVVAELADNAIRFSHPGTQVRVSVARQGDRAVLTVLDEGPGVAPEEAEDIFREFYVAAGHAGTGGPGLGLALAARIVDRHRGRLELSSEPGAGSTFSVLLPLGAGTTAT